MPDKKQKYYKPTLVLGLLFLGAYFLSGYLFKSYGYSRSYQSLFLHLLS